MTNHMAQLSAVQLAKERSRIRDIIALGRIYNFPQLAQLLAFDWDLSADRVETAFVLAQQDRNPRSPS